MSPSPAPAPVPAQAPVPAPVEDPADADAGPSNAIQIASADKLRFLCLHGYRQNADSFKSKTGAFRKTVNRYADFVFISAPHVAPPLNDGDAPNEEQRSWWSNKEDGTFRGTNKSGPATGIEESIKLVEKAWKEQGPFHGLLGFSQGACFVGILCSLAMRECKRAFDLSM